jgi:signal transduction histidine kinase
MTIRTAMRIIAIVLCGMAILVVWICATTSAKVAAVKKRAELIAEVTTGVFELNMLANEFVRHEEQRPRELWPRKHTDVADLLPQVKVTTKEEQELLASIIHHHRETAKIFEQLVQTVDHARVNSDLSVHWQKRLSGQLLLRSHNMISCAQALGDASRKELIRVQKTADRIVLLILVSLLLVFLTSGFLVVKKILRPLAKLHDAVQVAAEGNLSAAVPVHSNDEIGEICRAFNTMTKNLREGRESLQKAHSELEVRVEERTAELKRSNAELEQFAYVASHDLQEPLRMVASYLQLLERRYKSFLDDEADKFIAYAVDGAKRMQQLISDLLAYSRVTTRGKAFQRTDVEEVLSTAIGNLRMAIEESDAQVIHDPLPTVTADAGQLVQVFQNLVGNAIKYRKDDPPRVHISARQQNGQWVVSVQDNGIGIEPKYFDRIFAIFQRLHGKGQYSGTGIGLALCKRIVERHRGEIWVESEPGKGSTFFVALPE